MQKVTIKVVAEKKVDNRTNNTGRPVNHTSARQVRLSKQYMTELDMDYVMNGGWFKLTTNCSGAYTFVKGDGEFKGDDKSTPDINEAWEGGKAPKKPASKKQPKPNRKA